MSFLPYFICLRNPLFITVKSKTRGKLDKIETNFEKSRVHYWVIDIPYNRIGLNVKSDQFYIRECPTWVRDRPYITSAKGLGGWVYKMTSFADVFMLYLC